MYVDLLIDINDNTKYQIAVNHNKNVNKNEINTCTHAMFERIPKCKFGDSLQNLHFGKISCCQCWLRIDCKIPLYFVNHM